MAGPVKMLAGQVKFLTTGLTGPIEKILNVEPCKVFCLLLLLLCLKKYNLFQFQIRCDINRQAVDKNCDSICWISLTEIKDYRSSWPKISIFKHVYITKRNGTVIALLVLTSLNQFVVDRPTAWAPFCSKPVYLLLLFTNLSSHL